MKPTKSARDRSSYRLPKPLGYWCSWYAFGEDISADKIHQQAKLARRLHLPIDTIMIDDGWTAWGDWQQVDQKKFPKGIGDLAEKIKALNFQPGLWLAPFLVSPKAQLLREHPEFFVRDQNGKLVNGFRSFPPLDHFIYRKYLLDFRHKAVQAYIYDSLDQIIQNWGISVLKLDFLYAPYFNPHLQNASQASTQVKQLLRYIRKKYPHIFVTACGCPFADAQGLVDSIRISKDSTAPPPHATWIRRLLYHKSMRSLEKKLHMPWLWRGLYPDPDVQMFALDTTETRKILNTLDDTFVRGYGDDLREVKREWLKR